MNVLQIFYLFSILLTELCRGQIGRYKLQKNNCLYQIVFSPTLFFGGGISYDHDDDVCNDDDDDSDAYNDADDDDDDDNDGGYWRDRQRLVLSSSLQGK